MSSSSATLVFPSSKSRTLDGGNLARVLFDAPSASAGHSSFSATLLISQSYALNKPLRLWELSAKALEETPYTDELRGLLK